MKNEPLDLFICYSHQDQDLRKELEAHLEILRRKEFIRIWHDCKIAPGRNWKDETETHLEKAEVILLLISPNFVASDDCYEVEMYRALERHRSNLARVVPIILRPVHWRSAPFGELQALPSNGEPVTSWKNRDQAFFEIAEGLHGIILEMRDIKNRKLQTLDIEDSSLPSLVESLEDAYRKHEELAIREIDTTAIRKEILRLKRLMREDGLNSGSQIGDDRFHLLDLLGKGGFATVWRTYDRHTHQIVALKVLHGQYAEDRTRRQRFFRGARKMEELQHQNIVRVLEKELCDGSYYYFTMEYVSGGTLYQAVMTGKAAGEAALSIVVQIGQALQFSHEQGVIHRDVKPENILLDEFDTPKLTDFDLARAIDTTGGTRTGDKLGTFLYMAPEAMENSRTAGVSADIYSLAMTTAFVLYGTDLPPKTLRDPKLFIDNLACSPGTRSVLAKATQWDPQERYSSVSQFLNDLDIQAISKETTTRDRETVDLNIRNMNGGNLLDSVSHGDPSKGAIALLGLTCDLNANRDSIRKYFWMRRSSSDILERGMPSIKDEHRRNLTVLKSVECVLPLPQERRFTPAVLGTLAWALDYYPGRDPEFASEAASLREQLLKPLRETFPPPPLDSLNWAEVPGGGFVLGSPAGVGEPDEHPAHRIIVSPFRMLAHPVTNSQYRLLFPDRGEHTDHPVVDINWYDAYLYSSWLGGRLPTEAEWEYAVRAGCSEPYCDSGDRKGRLEDVGWISRNSGGQLHRVMQLAANPWGLYDMYGNVWEWVADWYGHYLAEPLTDPWNPPRTYRRVIRGGCFWSKKTWARAAYRDSRYPNVRFENRGFRVVLPRRKA